MNDYTTPYSLSVESRDKKESESESDCVVETNPRKYPDGDQPFNCPIFLKERARDLGMEFNRKQMFQITRFEPTLSAGLFLVTGRHLPPCPTDNNVRPTQTMVNRRRGEAMPVAMEFSYGKFI